MHNIHASIIGLNVCVLDLICTEAVTNWNTKMKDAHELSTVQSVAIIRIVSFPLRPQSNTFFVTMHSAQCTLMNELRDESSKPATTKMIR